MSRTRIKICGIKDVDTALAAADAGADAVGLVFVPKSPRCVTEEVAQQIIAQLPPFVEPVALFCDAPTERVISLTHELGIHTVQLHGAESISYVDYLAPTRLRVLKAFHADENLDVTEWLDQCANLSAILLDTPPAAGDQLTGGSGRAFDWNTVRLKAREGWPPVLLAGGLTPDNVAEAVRIVRPFGVDVSSGVESSRGVKDVARIQAFCAAVRKADESG